MRLPRLPLSAGALLIFSSCSSHHEPARELVLPRADSLPRDLAAVSDFCAPANGLWTVEAAPDAAERVAVSETDPAESLHRLEVPLQIRCAVATEEELATLFEVGIRSAPVPVVLLDGQMLVIATGGERSSTGHAVLIDSILERRDTLFVHVREVSPGPGCSEGAAIDYPVAAVRLPRRGAVRFVDRFWIGESC